jgi:hypothetical protein
MVNEKSLASKEQSIAKAPTAEEAIDPGAEKRPGIFVRLSPFAKQVLETAATGSTYAKVIESLLEYFERQESDHRDKILRGIHTNPLKDSQDLVAQLHRAQHAFENKRFYYAVQTYNLIAKDLEGVDKSEALLEVCNYRLGHCWIRLSYDLRVEALSPLSSDSSAEDHKAKCSEIFEIAQGALDLALRYLVKVKADGDPLTKLISHYNRACCYSLKAQYMVESKLDPQSRSELRNAAVKPDRLETQRLWRYIGDTWRKKDDDRRPDAQAREALKELREVYSKTDQPLDDSESVGASSLSSGRTWLVEIANDDEDLTFMRSDESLKPLFDDWRTGALQEDNSIAKAINTLAEESRQRLDGIS